MDLKAFRSKYSPQKPSSMLEAAIALSQGIFGSRGNKALVVRSSCSRLCWDLRRGRNSARQMTSAAIAKPRWSGYSAARSLNFDLSLSNVKISAVLHAGASDAKT